MTKTKLEIAEAEKNITILTRKLLEGGVHDKESRDRAERTISNLKQQIASLRTKDNIFGSISY